MGSNWQYWVGVYQMSFCPRSAVLRCAISSIGCSSFSRKPVPTVGLNALIYSGHGLTVGTGLRENELQPILDMAQHKTAERGQKLIWYTPTQYCQFDPTANRLGVKGCTAALYSMCIESNGNVLPCQSYYQSLGNLLTDSWDSIWNHKLSVQLRERQNLPGKCEGCPVVAECGGGCPLKFENAAQIPLEMLA